VFGMAARDGPILFLFLPPVFGMTARDGLFFPSFFLVVSLVFDTCR
jgi:hypothetical protein